MYAMVSCKAGTINWIINLLIDKLKKMIITNLLIIDHLISVPVILPYLSLALKTSKLLTIFYLTFEQVQLTTQCCV